MNITRIHLRPLIHLWVILLLMVQVTLVGEENDATVEDKNSESKSEVSLNAFERFKLILDRNIFDPDRRAPRERNREARPEPPREESFTLLGTMSYADKHLAFFDGSDSNWAGAVKLGESLANHKVVGVEYDKVLLEYAGETIELAIGSARMRKGEEAWESKDELQPGSYQSSSNRLGSSKNSDEDDSSGPDLSELESNDILKQLMERRKQQMGQ